MDGKKRHQGPTYSPAPGFSFEQRQSFCSASRARLFTSVVVDSTRGSAASEVSVPSPTRHQRLHRRQFELPSVEPARPLAPCDREKPRSGSRCPSTESSKPRPCALLDPPRNTWMPHHPIQSYRSIPPDPALQRRAPRKSRARTYSAHTLTGTKALQRTSKSNYYSGN